MEHYHIAFRGKEWKYSKADAESAVMTFENKLDAISYANEQLKNSNQSALLTIHKKNGDIQSEYRYPNGRRSPSQVQSST